MKLVPLVLFPLLLLGSCGKKIELPKDESPVASTTYSNSPVFLKVQDQQCFSGHNNRSTPYKLYLFLNGRHEIQDKSFSFTRTSNLLKDNSLLKRVYFGEKVETVISQGASTTYQREAGKELNLCSETRSYSPLSVESVALNAVYYMQLTKDHFNRLFPNIHVTPVTLNLLPSIQKSVLTKNSSGGKMKLSSFLTDNAFYMPRHSSITFLPHSLDMKKQGFNANFWEIPMIISHEYGHHLFQMIYQGHIESAGGHSCFGDFSGEEISNKRMVYRDVKHSDILNAYNEAFADLVAYYSLDAEYSLKGVKCLEYSRDINSATFYDGTLKTFGRRALDIFFSTVKKASQNCESHNYQEPHILGAIFAYNVDSYMNLFTNSKEDKFTVLVNWLNYLKVNKEKLSLLGTEEFLQETYKVFIQMATSRLNGSYSTYTCQKIHDSFPELQIEECFF